MADELTTFLLSRKPAGFRSHPYYSKEGDFLTYFFEGVDHFAERVDDVLTVFQAMDDERVIGFKLKGLAHLWRVLGDCSLDVFDPDDCLRLSVFLTAGLLRTKEPDALPVYQKFVRQTKGVRVPREVIASCC
jgi:hypothetical protein